MREFVRPLERRLHDFFCMEPEEMYNKELAVRLAQKHSA